MALRVKTDLPKILIAVFLIWFFFFYRIGTGTRSIAEHIVRIVTTPEAKELGHEVLTEISDITHAVTRRVRGAVVGYP